MQARGWAAAAALALTIGQASAATTVYYHAGSWHAFSGTDAQSREICGIGTENRQDGRTLNLTYPIGGETLYFEVHKPSWDIPQGTTIAVLVAINGGAPFTVQATGSGTNLTWSLGADTIRQFDNQFRAGSRLTLTFPSGNEQPWQVSLTGSAAADNTFARCINDLTRRAQPAPAAAPPVATEPFGRTATQPFSPQPGSAGATPVAPPRGAPSGPPPTTAPVQQP
ncbi:MAG: hypothetical protein ACREF3_07655 [Acetobacteraceae bacterium]